MKRRYSGSRRNKTRPVLKGRQIESHAVERVAALVGSEPLRRDLLIEYLHLIQDQYGHLSSSHIAALAYLMRLSQTEVYEVATFYAHFDVVKEGEKPPPLTTIRVCDSIACELAGAEQLISKLQTQAGLGIRVLRASCMGRCDNPPVAEVKHNHMGNTDVHALLEAARSTHHTKPEIPDFISYQDYIKSGGYQLLQRCLSEILSPEEVIQVLDDSTLRGLGGAGFPTGRKWGIVRSYEGPRMMAVNADEGEPGTFKDRYYLETDPHRVIEGMLIAAWAVGAEQSYVYVRDEYPAIISLMKTEIQAVRDAGLAKHVEIEVRRGAGAYICGEESAMIESIEGKRGLPRNRPPYIAEVGIFGQPTLENNVETLYWVRDIIEKGAKWYARVGVHGRKGWRSYSVSGRVNNPGVKLAPAGTTMNELIAKYCDGMQAGHVFKGFLPGGASGGILPATFADEPLDFDTLQKHGCFIGSAAIVVLSDQDNMKNVALNLMKFFEHESCGQCTPCRVGTEKSVKVMMKSKWDTELLSDLSAVMTDASICGLGQAAGNPINSVLKYFPEDL